MKLTSFIIKTALMNKYRFNNQCLCVDEVHTGYGEMADIVVDTSQQIFEIEIKVSKSDLWRGEAKKKKHKYPLVTKMYNQYYICVPNALLDEAKKWVEATNDKYGIIEFKTEPFFNKFGYENHRNYCYIKKRAKYLNESYSKNLHKDIEMRLSSALTTQYERIIKEMKQKELNK